ncbi:uncharacterized protein MKK02DRAFT_32921 [Dioszegia hungarica]|uniref:Uncharacterized protein n=1 Tax=Dioszegia hungarica TaxID=4972 RepID=A0AA38LUG9_9TREE|nr:uncharacterized protein MKK02DRAFT_32921 [Dioszegia hungarica]KAI9635518.1 hypothetical protein MKK02DRAFT_32921 [Dioszegia hungarica]
MVQPGQTQPARGLFPFNPNGGYIPSISPAQFQVQPDLRHQPQNQPNPRFQPPSTQPPTPFGPSYLRDRWYASESVRTAATALHNRIYVPAAFSPDVRYDALFRPIITCAIDWSEVHGPFLTVRMWRWTGWFAPGETGLVVEKFLGRHGLRHPNNKEPAGLALKLEQILAGLPLLKSGMIKLPPNGCAKLLIAARPESSDSMVEVFLEGDGHEVVESGLWEGNLNRLFSGGRVRDASLPLIMALRLAPRLPTFRPEDVPHQDAYDPRVMPIPVLGAVPPQSGTTYHQRQTTAQLRTPPRAAPSLFRGPASPSSTILGTPTGGEAHPTALSDLTTEGIWHLPGPVAGLGNGRF